MKAQVLTQEGDHTWVVFGRDPEKPDYVIDTNEYIIISDGKAIVMDPGGTEIFPEVVTAITQHIPVEAIKFIFGSHQDPDILSSLSLWLSLCPDAKIYVPWTWTSFITHFGCNTSQMVPIPDEGGTIELSKHCTLQIIPAHYLHASGNVHLYDPKTKMYFSGDVGAALLPDDVTSLFVEDFDEHIKYMEGFHKRWMPSNQARDHWLARVRKLDIEMMCPQHGSIFRGEQVQRFFDWFESLDLGVATKEPIQENKKAVDSEVAEQTPKAENTDVAADEQKQEAAS